jgi:hypothetical protein
MKNRIFLTFFIGLILSGCASTILPPVTCDIIVPTKSVEVFRKDGRRIFENKCEIEQGRRCDSEYVDEVEKFAYSSMTLSDLIHLRKIQKNQCN